MILRLEQRRSNECNLPHFFELLLLSFLSLSLSLSQSFLFGCNLSIYIFLSDSPWLIEDKKYVCRLCMFVNMCVCTWLRAHARARACVRACVCVCVCVCVYLLHNYA